MRAEGVEWRSRTDNLAGDCSLCSGIIPPGELFLHGKDPYGEVCLSCILTAIRGILPGSPQQVVLEIDPEQPAGTVRYVLDVDGKPAGTTSVDLSLTATEQYAPALLGTVCVLLEARQQYQGTPNPRLYESTAGDGWCTGEPPADEWLEAWVRGPKAAPGDWRREEFWTPGIFTVPDQGIKFLGVGPGERTWCFTYKTEPRADLEVLAWKRGPARPRFLEARDA